jgi:hypothetical protein
MATGQSGRIGASQASGAGRRRGAIVGSSGGGGRRGRIEGSSPGGASGRRGAIDGCSGDGGWRRGQRRHAVARCTQAIQGSYTGALPNLVVVRWLRQQPYLVDLRYIRLRDLLLVVRRAASRCGTIG